MKNGIYPKCNSNEVYYTSIGPRASNCECHFNLGRDVVNF
jgi:hypothetical protein